MITRRAVMLGLLLSITAWDRSWPHAADFDCIECKSMTPSKYDVRVERTVKTKIGLLINVSIKNADIDRKALGCLLAKTFSREMTAGVIVQVFDNREAARRYVLPQEQEKPEHWLKYEKSRRAIFTKHEKGSSLVWYDDPMVKEDKKATEICICPLSTPPIS
jgi:hypothetical protein